MTRAEDIRSILASVVREPVAVVPAPADGSWLAWFAGDDPAALAHRAALRDTAPELAGTVSWIAVDHVPDPPELLARRRAPAIAETALEQIVAVAWQEALGVAPRTVDEDFFAAGGHSLLAADVAARLKDLLGIDVPLTMVLDRPTVSEQASWLAAARGPVTPQAPRGAPVIVRVLAVAGAFDRDALARGLAAMAARSGGAEALLREVNLGDRRGPERRAAWLQLAGDLERPFTAAEPAWRAVVVEFVEFGELGGPRPARRRLLALAFDGRRLDATSASLLTDDLAQACAAAAEHRAPVWPRRPRVEAALELAAPVAVGWRAVRISAARARALIEVGRRQAASPLATFAAAIAVLIARRSDRTEVVLAIPASRRVGPDQRAAVGPLTTTMATAISLAGGPSFSVVVEQASRAICRGWATAAGLIATDPAVRPAVADASVELELPVGPRGGAWRAAAHPGGGAAGLAFVLRQAASGVVTARIGYDGLDVTAADAAAIAAGLDELVDELVDDPARALAGLPSAAPAIAADVPALSPPAPLTHAQERLWFLEDLAPGTTTNHLQRIYRLDGKLDRDALARSLAAMSRRHDGLRTVFRVVDASPRQLVARALPLEHRVDELPPAGAADHARLVAAHAAADYARPFELAHGPLWRTRLACVAPEDHRLILTIHHLIVDALSILVWYRELVEHYHAEISGTTPRLTRIRTSVAAVAAWERSPAGQQRIADDLGFWLTELAGVTPLELPIDHRRPTSAGLGRHEIYAPLAADRAAMIRALGRRHGATLNVTLLAAAAGLLARHTQQDDLVCIVPASRRDDPGRRDVIGLLLNLLPLRLRLDGDPTFAEIIARTHRALHRALAHSEAPFERIVAGLGLAREPGRQPLFDVILNMVPGAERLAWGDLQVTLDGVTGSAQPCDLVLGASTKPGGILELALRCRDDLFAPRTAVRWMARFQTFLLAAVASPHARLSELAVMPDHERRTVHVTWNRTRRALPEATVHGLVEARVRERPDAVAIVQGERRLSYHELDRRADHLAARLRARVAPGTHVGVLVAPSPELAIAALGVLKAGAVYVPLDPDQPASRLAPRAREVALVVTEPATRDLIAMPGMMVGDAAPAAPAPASSAGSPDAIAYVVFTSGSTGGPKGVATTHRALVNQIAWFARALPWRPGEVACLRSSPAFVDSLWELFGPLAGGIPLVVATAAERADPRLLVAAADHHRVTRMVVVPSLLRAMLELGGGRGDFLPALTLWLATSEELKPALVKAFHAARPGSRLVNLYGASETADQVAAHVVSSDDARAPRIPIGRPIANTKIYILDRAGRPLPIGVPGEICVTGVGISERYLGDVPAAQQAKFAASPFAPNPTMYRTGDRGRWRHDGVLEYIGRFDHLLKIRGIRVDPGEVESAILAHPNIAAAAVTAHAGFDGEQRLAAYLVARGPGAPPPVELRRFLRTTLPETLIPTSFLTVDALPLGPTGKLDRAALPAPQPMGTTSRPPHGTVEHAVALAWEHLLGRPMGAEDDFFAAGGQSLLAAQLGARLAERFAVELPLVVLFERPTIAAQAAWLETAVLSAPHAGIARIGDAPVPLSFAQDRLRFAASLAPQAPAPKLRFALRLEGPLDRDRLEAAMTLIAARHASLRTVFAGDGPSLRQRVIASCPRDHVFVELAALATADRQAAIGRHIDDERDKPFELTCGPPWRTRLLRLAEHAHVLIVAMHHYVSDGISVQLWLDELHEHYTALAADRPPAVPELTVGAADVAVWQHRMADSGFWELSRQFWRQTLAGATPIDLPLAAPRTGWSSGRSGSLRGHLGLPEADALAALARSERTTLFGLLLAAVGVLLHRLTGRTDLIVGTIAAGRDRPEVRPLLGLFLNPLPLRLALDGDPTLREIVGAAGRASRAALAHSDVPFERIVADVNPERRPYRQPLFDVVLNHHPPAPAPRLGDLHVSYVRGFGAPVTPYELMIRTIARGNGLTVQLDHQRDRFADDAVAGWLAAYLDILRQLATTPDRRLSAAG